MIKLIFLTFCLGAALPAAAADLITPAGRVTYLQMQQCSVAQTQAGSLYIQAGGRTVSRSYAPQTYEQCEWVNRARTVETWGLGQ
jgi:hypothetical protein